jgi:hypothetical protein
MQHSGLRGTVGGEWQASGGDGGGQQSTQQVEGAREVRALEGTRASAERVREGSRAPEYVAYWVATRDDRHRMAYVVGWADPTASALTGDVDPLPVRGIGHG